MSSTRLLCNSIVIVLYLFGVRTRMNVDKNVAPRGCASPPQWSARGGALVRRYFACSPEREGEPGGGRSERTFVRKAGRRASRATATRITTTIRRRFQRRWIDDDDFNGDGDDAEEARFDQYEGKRLKTSVSPRGRAKSTDDARSPRNGSGEIGGGGIFGEKSVRG